MGAENRFYAHPFIFFYSDGSRRGDSAAEEPAEGAGGAGPSGGSSWLGSPQPADGTAEQTGRTESGHDQCPGGMTKHSRDSLNVITNFLLACLDTIRVGKEKQIVFSDMFLDFV